MSHQSTAEVRLAISDNAARLLNVLALRNHGGVGIKGVLPCDSRTALRHVACLIKDARQHLHGLVVHQVASLLQRGIDSCFEPDMRKQKGTVL